MADGCSIPLTPLLEVGATLADKYRIERLLAEGGMGIVYEGYHVELEQRVAVKVVRAEYAHHQEAVARFLNEARAIARLRGHHIAKVLDTGRTESGAPYMVLEYLEGRDLRTVLDTDGPLPIAQAVHYLLQTCEAVTEAHAIGLIHRDLKPDNLFISRGADGQDVLKVIDFGISKRIDGNGRCLTKQGQSLGSPHYMAPEQMSSPELVDARADIWSLGIVLYELLTNSVPFSGETLAQACMQVLTAEPRRVRQVRPEVPAELERIIARCLAKQRDERYATVKELAAELSAFAPDGAQRAIPWLRAPLALAPVSDSPTLVSPTDAPMELTRTEGATSSIRAIFHPNARRNKIIAAAAAAVALVIWGGIQAHAARGTDPVAENVARASDANMKRATPRLEPRIAAAAVAPLRATEPKPEAPAPAATARDTTPPSPDTHSLPDRSPTAHPRSVARLAPAKPTRMPPVLAPVRATPAPAPANNDAAELVNPYPDLAVTKKPSRSALTNP